MNNETTPVYQDALTRIMNLMKATYGGNFKAYYEGDPLVIPKANLPCMIIEAQAGRVDLAATSTDRFQSQINIRLIFNKSDDFNASDTDDLSERKLRKMVEGRDPVTNQFLPNSVLGALRTNFTLRSNLIENDIDWEYNLQPRAEGVVTSEALVQVVAVEKIIIPNRQ